MTASSPTEAEAAARQANDPERWDQLWGKEGAGTWRKRALADVYDRICHIMPEGARVVDVGGGVGALAELLMQAGCASVEVWDHSETALEVAERNEGVTGRLVDLEAVGEPLPLIENADVVVATELLEHLSAYARDTLVTDICQAEGVHSAIFSIPNDCMGPDVEPQHSIQWTAMDFKRFLQDYFSDVRIEVFGRYQMAVCGEMAKKAFTLSVCLPVRDEEADLERVLASFRGAADQIVVGVDPRTVDGTREIAAKYADLVFELEDPALEDLDNANLYVDADKVRPDGVHFSWVRNQCMDRCTGDWIFMTEGHESLAEGQDRLLNLDALVPENSPVCMVWRSGQGQRWAFPWLCRREAGFRYERSTHNELVFPRKTLVTKLPGVRTDHFRDHSRSESRAAQRRAQNRRTLMDDWMSRKNEQSLFYLGQEWRGIDPARSIDRLQAFLATSNNGCNKYQARLVLAKELYGLGKRREAEEVLLGCAQDDWSRTEHWIWLGDINFEHEDYARAYQFYRYATTSIGDPPFTVWWISMDSYTYLPAQRMTAAAAAVGRLEEACHWAEKAASLLPSDTPDAVRAEAEANVRLLRETLDGSAEPS